MSTDTTITRDVRPGAEFQFTSKPSNPASSTFAALADGKLIVRPMTDLRYSSFERFELELTIEQAESCSHQGQCDDDVEALSREPAIKAQLDKLEPSPVHDELREYGAWDDSELADHDQNLQRVLWLACSDIVEEERAR